MGQWLLMTFLTPLDENVFEEFGHLVNPLAESESFGIDIYIRALEALSKIQERDT